MNRHVRLTSVAQRDLVRVLDFLSDKNPKAARKAADLIDSSIKSLALLSERGHPGPTEDVREISVRFGKRAYIIRYRVEPQAVVVARVFHSNEQR